MTWLLKSLFSKINNRKTVNVFDKNVYDDLRKKISSHWLLRIQILIHNYYHVLLYLYWLDLTLILLFKFILCLFLTLFYIYHHMYYYLQNSNAYCLCLALILFWLSWNDSVTILIYFLRDIMSIYLCLILWSF